MINRSALLILSFSLVMLSGCAPGFEGRGIVAAADSVQDENDNSTGETESSAIDIQAEQQPANEPLIDIKVEVLRPESRSARNAKVDILPSALSHLDPSRLISRPLLAKAARLFVENSNRFKNQKVITIVDLSLPSSVKRLYIINLATGAVFTTYSAHGSGSDRNHDGLADKFSNKVMSLSSSLGVYLATTAYTGARGYSLRLHGLSKTNSNAWIRAVVLHGANYVKDAPVKQGRSWGCVVVPMNHRMQVIDTLKGGSFLYVGLSKP